VNCLKKIPAERREQNDTEYSHHQNASCQVKKPSNQNQPLNFSINERVLFMKLINAPATSGRCLQLVQNNFLFKLKARLQVEVT